jgi:hypothetical protein
MMHGSASHSTWNNADSAGIDGSGSLPAKSTLPRFTLIYLSTYFACLFVLLTADAAPGDDGRKFDASGNFRLVPSVSLVN